MVSKGLARKVRLNVSRLQSPPGSVAAIGGYKCAPINSSYGEVLKELPNSAGLLCQWLATQLHLLSAEKKLGCQFH